MPSPFPLPFPFSLGPFFSLSDSLFPSLYTTSSLPFPAFSLYYVYYLWLLPSPTLLSFPQGEVEQEDKSGRVTGEEVWEGERERDGENAGNLPHSLRRSLTFERGSSSLAGFRIN